MEQSVPANRLERNLAELRRLRKGARIMSSPVQEAIDVLDVSNGIVDRVELQVVEAIRDGRDAIEKSLEGIDPAIAARCINALDTGLAHVYGTLPDGWDAARSAIQKERSTLEERL